MNIPFPSVYKFSSLNINSLSALAEGKAWFSKLTDFNDPFEGQFIITPPDLSNNESRERFFNYQAKKLPSNVLSLPAIDLVRKRYYDSPKNYDNFMKDITKKLRDSIYSRFLDVGAYCLASDESNEHSPQICNTMLWSHYADGMKGFCIKFNPNKLLASLNKLNKERFYWSKVDYQNKMCSVDYYSADNLSRNETVNVIQTKHINWAYEYELRIFTETSGLYKYSFDSIDGIYLGGKMPVSHQKILVDICKVNLPNIMIYGVKTHKEGYIVEVGEYISSI
ncbi:DUF2971 domain-containing protein [Pectobacterium brasiliense]|uniref:DUF2971 domain-containing protein n=1 Tax=Pectobacterium brasiliense TaxID=180957 RepID=UPI0015DE7011|nr:DUF2971 domain-containing protein [Pectobacterium brasiliense]MBA0218798.1 DUF2971 domain-containing protein [Pectobacterium brasiliense]MBN3073192.1 DUF2971 domain-containing protein [Pectobacterium brasiliense]MBN3170613.1 DUF2971 domain-containing protein [Pectobacterium brasiliense]